MEQARGEYIARQDFDDRSYPDRLRLQVALLDADPKVGIVGGAYLLVDERRGERYVRMPPTDHAALFAAMARYVPIAHTVATFRRQAWVEAGGYPLVDNLIDLRFYLRVAKLGWRFANVPEVVGEHLRARHQLVPPAPPATSSGSATSPGCRRRAIRELGLPRWMYVYSLGRHVYAYVPPAWKRVLRRGAGRSQERDQ